MNVAQEQSVWTTLEELLQTDNSVSVHHRNTEVLARTELHKIVNGLSPEIMKEIFPFKQNTTYDTRNKKMFHLRPIKLVTFGSERQFNVKPKIWELAPVEIKNVYNRLAVLKQL